MTSRLSQEELAHIEARGYDEGGQIHQDYKRLAAEIDRLAGGHAMLSRQLGEAERHVRKTVPREDVVAIRAALGELPVACRYHQDRLDPDRPGWGREACCDTGLPALRRRNAMAALDRIEAARG